MIKIKTYSLEEVQNKIIEKKPPDQDVLNMNCNATMATLMKVFTALKANVKLQVALPNLNIIVGQ